MTAIPLTERVPVPAERPGTPSTLGPAAARVLPTRPPSPTSMVGSLAPVVVFLLANAAWGLIPGILASTTAAVWAALARIRGGQGVGWLSLALLGYVLVRGAAGTPPAPPSSARAPLPPRFPPSPPLLPFFLPSPPPPPSPPSSSPSSLLLSLPLSPPLLGWPTMATGIFICAFYARFRIEWLQGPQHRQPDRPRSRRRTHRLRPSRGWVLAPRVAVYPFSPAAVDAVRDQLPGARLSKGTVRFTAEAPLPERGDPRSCACPPRRDRRFLNPHPRAGTATAPQPPLRTRSSSAAWARSRWS